LLHSIKTFWAQFELSGTGIATIKDSESQDIEVPVSAFVALVQPNSLILESQAYLYFVVFARETMGKTKPQSLLSVLPSVCLLSFWASACTASPFSPFPLSHPASNIERLAKRADTANTDSNWPIKTGYVAFGDSYAAGMGTGKTTTDSCRVGEYNIGDLLNKWTNNPGIDFQRKICSGDTLVGLNRQIDEWENPTRADVATISTGGNDVGFSDLVINCVITPYTWKLGSTMR
jgi:hypothetical protein